MSDEDEGAKASNLLSLDETLTITRIMEQTRKQIGVTYSQDDCVHNFVLQLKLTKI